MEEVVLRLQRDLDLAQAAFTKARNDLAMYILERRRARYQEWASHGKLIVGFPASRSAISVRMGA